MCFCASGDKNESLCFFLKKKKSIISIFQEL